MASAAGAGAVVKALSAVDSLLDVLFNGLITGAELAAGILRAQPDDLVEKAAVTTHFRAQLAFGVLYDLLEADDLPADVAAGLRARLNLTPGTAAAAKAEADQAATALEHLRKGTATILRDPLKLPRGEA